MCNCSESGCGSSCGQPKTYVTTTGVQGQKGENLVFYNYTSGGTVTANTFTQINGSSYSLPAGALENGDYIRYINEFTNSGSISVVRYVSIRLNDTDLFGSTTPDTMSNIVVDTGHKRGVFEIEFLKTSNTSLYVTAYIKLYDSASKIDLETVYFMTNVDLSTLPIDLSVSPLEISAYYKGDGTNGLTHLKTKVLQYNQQ